MLAKDLSLCDLAQALREIQLRRRDNANGQLDHFIPRRDAVISLFGAHRKEQDAKQFAITESHDDPRIVGEVVTRA